MTTKLNDVLDSLLIAPDYNSWKETWEKYVALNPKKSLSLKLSSSIKPLRRKRSRSLSDIRVYDSFFMENESTTQLENKSTYFPDDDNFKTPLPPDNRQPGHSRAERGLRRKRSRSLTPRESPIAEPVWTSFQAQIIGDNITDFGFPEPLPGISEQRKLKRRPSWQSQSSKASDESSDFEDQTSYKVLYSSKRPKYSPVSCNESDNISANCAESSQDLDISANRENNAQDLDSLKMPKNAFSVQNGPEGKRFYCTFEGCNKCISC
jgi:hypothetical protein